MPVRYTEKDKETWTHWLLDDLGSRLDQIKGRVEHLVTTCLSKNSPPKWFTPHGPEHFARVEANLHLLIPGDKHKELGDSEKFFLLGAAWVHDIGMMRGIFPEHISDEDIRNDHHYRSEKYLIEKYQEIDILKEEAEAFGFLARFHRRRCPLKDCPKVLSVPGHGEIRLRLLAAYIRLADALDVTQSRTKDDQYAISLAYDLPPVAKLHWLRSRFILGIEVDYSTKSITVHLKHPINWDRFEGVDFPHLKRNLEGIYDFIMQDLIDELESVKDILVAENITYYLFVERKIRYVEFDNQLEIDLKTFLNYFLLLDNPSSSALSLLILDSIGGIFASIKTKVTSRYDKNLDKELNKTCIKQIRSLLREVDENVLKSRKCHIGLRNLIKQIKNYIDHEDLDKLEDYIKNRKTTTELKRNALRFSAFRFFEKEMKKKEHINIIENVANILSGHESCQKINILLYGFSELVMKTLCGFRDAVIFHIIGKYCEQLMDCDQKENVWGQINWGDEGQITDLCHLFKNSPMSLKRYFGPSFHHKECFEDKASDLFRIFICDGQPKNQTGWGNRIIYNDGKNYSAALSQRGFKNIHIIPDATALTLLAPFSTKSSLTDIHFVIVGTNGFNNDEFKHSAGHTMVVAGAKLARECHGDYPKLVLSTITDKYLEVDDDEKKDDICIEKKLDENCTKAKPDIVEKGGWLFRNSFCQEPVRISPFFSQNQKYHQRFYEEHPDVLFYNPREDSIPIENVNVVITEKTFIEKDCIDDPTLITGRVIHDLKQDSENEECIKDRKEKDGVRDS